MTGTLARFLPIALIAVACGSAAASPGDATFTAAAYTTVMSEGGKLTVELRTTSDTPARVRLAPWQSERT